MNNLASLGVRWIASISKDLSALMKRASFKCFSLDEALADSGLC